MRLKIAARQSDLARLQAQSVGEALRAVHGDKLEIEFQFRASLGDMNQQDPLWKMPEKGVFTDDFLEDLKSDRVDLVVHSWKDLPTEHREHTMIGATLPRADVRDLLLVRRDRLEGAKSKKRLRVLTSSPRRSYNLNGFLQTYLPLGLTKVEFKTVRGNIPTRVRKLLSEDVDALILAKAALDRLLSTTSEEYVETRRELRQALAACAWVALPLSLNPTAAAQGALAVEIKRGRNDLIELLRPINCKETYLCVDRERQILAQYGGGCHQKIGVNVLMRPYGAITFLRGQTDGGEVLNRVDLKVPGSRTASGSGRLSEKVLWPSENRDRGFFSRETLSPQSWMKPLQDATRVWVARETALPLEAKLHPEALVWCAGLRTWRKLAERGIWVNGCSEGLGETESPNIAVLAGAHAAQKIEWLKLTHAAAGNDETVDGQLEFRTLPTYKLVPEENIPDLEGKTHFYWMSGSTFERALELFPEIRSAHHACGPGKTYAQIKKALGSQVMVDIYLSYDEWRRELLGLDPSLHLQ